MPSARDHLLNLLNRYVPARVEAALAAFTAEELDAAATRVAALPTANEGQLIHATREQILNTIRAAAKGA